jgi:WD40 repeat protein
MTRPFCSGMRSAATLRGHSDSVTSVAFSTDGTRMVSGSDDNTLRLWDVVSGVPLDTHPQDLFSFARSLSSSWTSFSGPETISSESTCVFSHLTADGWIYSATLNRRICWVPGQFRPCARDVTKDRVAFGTDDGRLVIIRFNKLYGQFALRVPHVSLLPPTLEKSF